MTFVKDTTSSWYFQTAILNVSRSERRGRGVTGEEGDKSVDHNDLTFAVQVVSISALKIFFPPLQLGKC